jgi:hypothetical protein
MKRTLLLVAVFLGLSYGRGVEAACVAGDTVGPTKIVDLTVEVVSSTGVLYRFTAPSDQSGLASYDVRYRTVPITALNFATATQVAGEPTPSISGTIEHLNISGLLPGTAHYMAMKTYDDCGKVSAMSNAVMATTLAAPVKTTATFLWDPNSESDLAGYRLYYGYKSVSDPTWVVDEYVIDVGNHTYQNVLLDPGTYYFRATAYNTSTVESIFSNELTVTVP